MLFVFMSQPDYACNPYALCEYIKNHTEHETAWLIKRDEKYYELRDRGIRCESYNTLEGNALLDEADYIIMNSYTFPNIQKRDDQIVVNLWHGSGIKAHDFYGHDMPSKRANWLDQFFEKTDLMCVHSLDDRFRLSAMLHFDLRRCYVTGQARLDCVRSASGHEKLEKLFGGQINGYQYLIFFAPSFRANGTTHSGKIFSDNIFRLNDFDKQHFYKFLKANNAALVYKLHPVEQTAFSGRKFELNEDCFELTDAQLFEHDIRYDELLNAFDVMVSDYSSIAFDYLMLDRPIVYLIPDYEEYASERGFVFNHVGSYMPGKKAFDFFGLLSGLEEAFAFPEKYQAERAFVLKNRFDFTDDRSAERCYQTIINYKKPIESDDVEPPPFDLPSSAELLKERLPEGYRIIDATKEIPEEYSLEVIQQNPTQQYLYFTEEMPRKLHKLTDQSSTEILDIEYYHQIIKCANVQICTISGGVDYLMFSAKAEKKYDIGARRRIGFAGAIDNRIFIAMVQCICEVFSDYDIIFAGEVQRNIPGWLQGFENLHYLRTSYEDLPAVIQTFDVAILPFFGRHMDTVPKEYFQYLACGKQVVTSNMKNLPDTAALYRSESVETAIQNIKTALMHIQDKALQESAKQLAQKYDWGKAANEFMEKNK